MADVQHSIFYKNLDVSITLKIPTLPQSCKHATVSVDSPDIKREHLAWKRAACPWLSKEILDKSCSLELESIQLGFPSIGDRITIRGMAAYLVAICYLDDVIELMEIEEAEICVAKCVAALEGSIDPKTYLSTSSDKARHHCQAFYTLIRRLFDERKSNDILEDVRSMLHGQILELRFKLGQIPVPDFATYLDVRFRPFGLFPLLRIGEYVCIYDSNSITNKQLLDKMKEQVVRMAILQNDIAGLEKDLLTQNLSNSIFVLGLLDKKTILSKEDILSNQHLLREAENKHDHLVLQVFETWSEIQQLSEGDRNISNMLLNLCVTHLQWSLATKRYSVVYTLGSAV